MSEPEIVEDARIFLGKCDVPHERVKKHTQIPPWRRFHAARQPEAGGPMPSVAEQRGKGYLARPEEIRAVNIALHLRRPLLVTGDPGTGKSTLAYAIAYELGLDDVLVWPITSRSTLQQGLYQYDAIGRLQDKSFSKGRTDATADIGRFIRLGPLGTALYLSKPNRPSVLLIDEIDKSDIDLPGDLLHVFEEGEFEIPELSRLAEKCPEVKVSLHRRQDLGTITRGQVRCEGFPLVLLTSNGERDFSPAFLRRCVRLDIKAPTVEELATIVARRTGEPPLPDAQLKELIGFFDKDRSDPARELATDQLLNAVYLLKEGAETLDHAALREFVFRSLGNQRAEAPEGAAAYASAP
jgi:MoxR-like ATPase